MIEDNLNRHKVYIPGNNLPTHINPDTLPISYLSGVPIKVRKKIIEFFLKIIGRCVHFGRCEDKNNS